MVAKLVLTVIAGFFVANFAAAQSASSQHRTAKMDRHFSYTDTDGNGFIGRDEAAHYPALMKHFGVIDSNKDGKLSKEEMQAYRLGTRSKQRAATAARKAKPAEDHSDDDAVTKADADDASATHRKNY
jgi:hypothetical protein